MESKKVLLIEDDVDLLEIEQMQLQNAGYEVTTAQELGPALQILEKESFDCILLDMNLQTDSGKDIILQVKNPEHLNCKTPIIVVSGDLNIELVRDVREKISSILVKPFSSSDLTEKLSAALNKAHMNRVSKNLGKTKTVFIVDDDKEYVKALKEFLEEEKFHVIASTSTHEAIIKLQNQKFDIILADLDIDHRNGEWLVNLMRRDSGHMNNKTPIIIVSGFLEKGSARMNELVQQVVAKPISLLKLTQTIRQELSQSKAPIVKSI